MQPDMFIYHRLDDCTLKRGLFDFLAHTITG